MKALCYDRFGGPEVLAIRDLPNPVADAGHVVVRTEAIGLNFADIHRRRGAHPSAGQPPYVGGFEAAGVVAAVGADAPLAVGTRVAFVDVPGANAELVRVPTDRLVVIPDGLPSDLAAAVLLQGLTAQFLTDRTFCVRPGHQVVVHAAAGGVGQLIVQMATRHGARVVGLCSTEAKRQPILEAGAVAAIAAGDGWVERVKRVEGFADGADAVFDSVGSTLSESLDCLRVGGTVALFGTAGGEPKTLPLGRMIDHSLSVVGDDLWNVVTTPTERQRRSKELFAAVLSGELSVNIAGRFSLEEGAEAHRFLESRAAAGKILLVPA